MATWEQNLQKSAALMNDQERATYTNIVLLPYMNIALNELQEIFELNNIPVTNETSATLTIPTGASVVGYNTIPALPADLIEIQQLWESQTGQNNWVPIDKREYLTADILDNTQITVFGVWAWMEQEIRLRAAILPIDIKIDYIRFLFTEVSIGLIGQTNTILNTDTFFIYRTAGLAAEFIEENDARADKLNAYGGSSLQTSLGISVKGKQSIPIRRRPFRSSYKMRGRRIL